ncbi:AbrB/MazE/SpoVT family DNA-binding domain-containing protein [Halobaculum sp. MBLA0147]|uniref:AbrB/MazE/SpoVT family DNA-binding domain-containing protein n=1 Tax=Halobaculum sp. MBLA0147 TaxID=3079934 RepID=UPI00352516EA
MSDTESEITRVSTDGRTTIPRGIRERLGVEPGDRVRWSVDGGAVTVEKATPASTHGILLADGVTDEERREVAEELGEYVREKRRGEWGGESTRVNAADTSRSGSDPDSSE